MAMTKRFRVSFDLKVVYTSEDVAAVTKDLLAVTRRFLEGEKLTGIQLECARVAAEGGVEAAIELLIKAEIQSLLREELRSNKTAIGNIRAEVRQ